MKRISDRYHIKYRTSKKKQLYLETKTVVLNTNFVRAHFFLLNESFEVKIVLHKEPVRSSQTLHRRAYRINLLQLSQNLNKSWQQGIGPNGQKKLVRIDGREDPQWIFDKKWLEISGLHNIDYFRMTMQPLVNWVIDNCYFNIIYEKVLLDPSDKRIPIEEDKKAQAHTRNTPGSNILQPNTQARDKFFGLVLCISRLQRAFKRIKNNEWLVMKQQRKEELDRQFRTIGDRQKRVFQKIHDKIFVINVYKRNDMYTFELIDYLDRNKKKQRLRVCFEYNSNKMYNTQQKTLIEYLIDKIQVDGEVVSFRENEYEDIELLMPPMHLLEVAEEQSETMRLDQLMTSKHFSLIDERSRIEEQEKIEVDQQLQDLGFEDKTSAVSNLVDYVHTTDPENGKEVLYNVVYTGKRPKQRQVQENQQGDEGKDKNTVRINVDLNELKKLYPTIDHKSQGLMKVIGEQLIEGIQLGKDGTIRVDQNQINVNCMQVTQNKIEISNEMVTSSAIRSEEEKKQAEKHDSKTILLQSTRFFNKNKFLILIYLVERKVKKIIQATQDTVFEEYEVLYQVYSLNLTAKTDVPLIWEISPEEIKGNIDGGSSDHMDHARYLMKRIQIFQSNYIFSVETTQQLRALRPNPNVVVFNEQGLKPIQVHFQSRRYRKNYKEFQKELQMKLSKVEAKFIPQELRSMRQYFLLVVFDVKSKWEFVAWDMISYQRFFLEIEKLKFHRFAIINQKITIESMARYLDIDIVKNVMSFNDNSAVDYLDQYMAENKLHKTHSN